MKKPGAKLTEDDVREIRAKYASGNYWQRELAKKYGVSRAFISQIVLRDAWGDVG